MKLKAKILLLVLPSLVALFSVGVLRSYDSRNKESASTNKHITTKKPAITPKEEPTPTLKKVAKEPTVIEGYILNYNKETNMVYLVTKYSDGSEIISHIKEIDTRFLEDEDVASLTNGIFLKSKEEMFLLIEDYSN